MGGSRIILWLLDVVHGVPSVLLLWPQHIFEHATLSSLHIIQQIKASKYAREEATKVCKAMKERQDFNQTELTERSLF